MPPSCALLGGFAIDARDALLWQHNANATKSELLQAPIWSVKVTGCMRLQSIDANKDFDGQSKNRFNHSATSDFWMP